MAAVGGEGSWTVQPTQHEEQPVFITDHTLAQQLGARAHQADAAAHHHNPITGHRAWVLLDGIGDREHVADWTPRTALALASAAAGLGDPRAAIELARPVLHAERAHHGHPKKWPADAAAIIAVLNFAGDLSIAWAGDCRAYFAERGQAHLLTTDHNEAAHQRRARQTPSPDAHDRLTSSLMFLRGEIGGTEVRFGPRRGTRRLLLASDGAYLPHEAAGVFPIPDGSSSLARRPRFLAPVLTGPRERVAQRLTELAVRNTPNADNATALVIDLTG
ncbi:protein phosphatase 2C domain-containing protein [Kitasatospora sp. NBC_00070]|uniref:serine/threonine protein phosphatase n=1 Tax=Kitasatospora sp. NBC_00070 TaxID=2975962 RepID=UPI003255BCD7